jgi:hypothetical protein
MDLIVLFNTGLDFIYLFTRSGIIEFRKKLQSKGTNDPHHLHQLNDQTFGLTHPASGLDNRTGRFAFFQRGGHDQTEHIILVGRIIEVVDTLVALGRFLIELNPEKHGLDELLCISTKDMGLVYIEPGSERRKAGLPLSGGAYARVLRRKARTIK